jgi:hypothetical protein
VATVFPQVAEQRCWNHRIVNVLDTLPKKLQGEGRALLTKIPYAETREEAERQKAGFQAWATKHGVPAAGRRLAEDWERLVTFYAFPKEHWKHLRTSNVVESPFAAVRLRRSRMTSSAIFWSPYAQAAERRYHNHNTGTSDPGGGRSPPPLLKWSGPCGEGGRSARIRSRCRPLTIGLHWTSCTGTRGVPPMTPSAEQIARFTDQLYQAAWIRFGEERAETPRPSIEQTAQNLAIVSSFPFDVEDETCLRTLLSDADAAR